jgi:4-oxalocrotonate tautomerase
VSTENYGAGGQLIVDRDAPFAKGDAHADPSQ